MPIKQLGYVAIDTTAADAWADLASGVLAFETVRDHPQAADGTQYFRMDEQHHRVTIHAGARNGLRHLGWQVESQRDLEDCVGRLQRLGIRVAREAPRVASERMVRALISFEDPAGFRHELYWGPVFEQRPFTPAQPISGYVTGNQGLGHAVLCAKDQIGLSAFFQETFGFRLSDTIHLEGIDIDFLRCNERHHSLAIMSPGQGVEPGQLHHVLFELRSLDDVGRAYDRVQQRKVPLLLTLGRHVNDRMISFYFKSPSGVGIEIGSGARAISDATAWTPVHYNYAGIWGHQFVG
jgi:extradiol dioxygenase